MSGLPRFSRRRLLLGGLALSGLGGLAALEARRPHPLRCPPDQTPPRPKAQYGLSLRALQEQLVRCSDCTDARALYGLTNVGGYVVDEPNRDIVLFGERRGEQRHLSLDDLVVALRNLDMRYAEERQGTHYFAYPTVSIDPKMETLRRITELGQELHDHMTAEDAEKIIAKWKEICAAQQEVRILGVPRHSRFARVMLDADYELKRVADGADDIQVAGLTSLMQASLDQAIAQAAKNKSLETSITSRFWLNAGESSYDAGRITFALTRVDVKLSTEEEFATETGMLKGTGYTEQLSEEFACRFSQKFPEIVMRQGIYRDLENLFRWMALARVMRDEGAVEQSGLDLAVLLEKFELTATAVPAEVPGRSAVGRYDSTDGEKRYRIRIPSCGGVEVAFAKGDVIARPAPPLMDEVLGRRILASRASARSQPIWRIA